MKTQTSGKFLPLFLLGIIATILRFFRLGNIPQGISLVEATLGLSISKYLGTWYLNPLFIRLPFAIFGTLSIFLFYFLIERITEDRKAAFLSALLLSITPWHIQESRILSVGILFTFLFLFLALVLLNQLKSHLNLLTKFFAALSVLLFIASILNSISKVSDVVDAERRFAVNEIPQSLASIYSNKLVESYRENLSRFYEHLDIGVYFFNGHPRQRWGVEETTKLFISFIPLILLGIVKQKNRLGLLIGAIFISFLTLFTFFKYRGPSETLPLVFIFIYLAGFGLNYLKGVKKLRFTFYFLLITLVYEILSFNSLYFSGFTESTFSPRRLVYEEVASKVSRFREKDEKVLVNERLLNPKTFFQFYLKDQDLDDFEFREYNVWNEKDRNILFVDVLPYEPSPSEPLYTKEGTFPEKLTLLYETKDEHLRQKIVIYRNDEN